MQKLVNYIKPLYSVVFINIIGFALLYFYKKPFDRMTVILGLLVIAVVYLTYFIILIKKLGDEYLFLITSMLVSIGIIMLYRLDSKLAVKQIEWLVGGIILFFLSYCIFIKFDKWNKFTFFYIGVSVVLFLLTLLFAKDIKGANNWIVIGNFNFQPSEIIKVLFIFFLACYYIKPENLNVSDLIINNKKIDIDNKIIFSIIAYFYFAFLILQREWGSALLFFIVYFVFLYVFNSSFKVLLLNAVIACIGGLLGYLLLYHIKTRVDMWLNPWNEIADKGYQITQSLFAIGNGGFFGTGLGMGRPDYIPEVNTDFIFSAICEEMGIFGGIAVILLFFIFIYRGFKISLATKEPFDKIIAFGLTLMFGFQTFIILGGVTKFIPLTGITLPFISYGGSSLITSFISLGILQAISKKGY